MQAGAVMEAQAAQTQANERSNKDIPNGSKGLQGEMKWHEDDVGEAWTTGLQVHISMCWNIRIHQVTQCFLLYLFHKNHPSHWNVSENCMLRILTQYNTTTVSGRSGLHIMLYLVNWEKSEGPYADSLHVTPLNLLLQIRIPSHITLLISGSSGLQFPATPQNGFNKPNSRRPLMPLILQVSPPTIPAVHITPENNPQKAKHGMLFLFPCTILTED